MIDIAAIGRQHLADQLAGEMHHCTVSEWPGEDGAPVKVYWKPLTGVQQRKIDAASGEVERVCMLVKLRALDETGRAIFADTALASLVNDYDYDVIRALAYIIAGNIGQGEPNVEDTELE